MKKKSNLDILMIMFGFTFFSGSMLIGQKLSSGVKFSDFLVCILIGGNILGIFGGMLGYIGAKTGKNIASDPNWKGRRSPWIGTKNIWKLFYRIGLLDEEIYNDIMLKRPQEWSEEFADRVYADVEKHKYFITNLGKCTQIDARVLPNSVYSQYLDLLCKEIKIINPKTIITLGNQVSSIVLNKNISVSQCRKQSFLRNIAGKNYSVYPVYYPIGNGMMNIDKAIEDLNYIIRTNFKSQKYMDDYER